jgi:hypothetical protein
LAAVTPARVRSWKRLSAFATAATSAGSNWCLVNPIEQLFAKLKHLVRKAEPRTIEDTWRKVGQILDLFSPAECANYLKNSGYDSV